MAQESFDQGMPHCSTQCLGCSRPFESGETIWSVLFVSQGRTRKDYCTDCWKQQPTPSEFWWRGVCTRTLAQDAAKQREQALLSLVQGDGDSSGDGEPANPEQALAKRYAAALALWRLRKLRLEQVGQDNGREVLCFRLIGTQKRYHIAHPGLSEDQLRNMEEDLLRTDPGGYVAPLRSAA